MNFLEQTQSIEEIKKGWINQWYMKSKSVNSKRGAEKALHWFERFLKEAYYQNTEIEMLNELKTISLDPTKVTNLYTFINKFVQYLSEKSKAPRTIRIYIMFIKSYLRYNGIKVYSDDMKEFVSFPKIIMERRKPMDMKIIRKLFENAEDRLKVIIPISVSSGARIGEVLQSRIEDFDFTISPVKFRIRAETTKTREERETFISSEASRILKEYIGNKTQGLIFCNEYNEFTLPNVEEAFADLRKKCSLLDKYNNGMHHVNIHAFRSFAFTKLVQKCGEKYAHALLGHHAYLDQYFRETPEERSAQYILAEKELTINLN